MQRDGPMTKRPWLFRKEGLHGKHRTYAGSEDEKMRLWQEVAGKFMLVFWNVALSWECLLFPGEEKVVASYQGGSRRDHGHLSAFSLHRVF